MGKRDKIDARISALESELLSRLVAGLPSVAARNADRVFLSSKVIPSSWPHTLRSSEADELTDLADQLIDLYAKRGIPSAGTTAERYLAASQACYDLSNHHRAAPDGFATLLLSELAAARP